MQTKDGGFVWFAVTKIDPAHDRTFDEVRAEVEKQWRAGQIDKALAGKADDLVKQLQGGAKIADVAKSAGAEAKTATDVHRDDKQLPESLVAAIFREPADGDGSAAVSDGRAVFKVTADHTPNVDFNDLRIKTTAERLDGATRDTLLSEYVDAVRRSVGVVINVNVMQSAEGS